MPASAETSPINMSNRVALEARLTTEFHEDTEGQAAFMDRFLIRRLRGLEGLNGLWEMSGRGS